jgi:hypothetical protein
LDAAEALLGPIPRTRLTVTIGGQCLSHVVTKKTD